MNYQNIVRIKVVYNALQELAEEVVFVGGATVAFYADRLASEIRPTDDIDILVELLNYRDFTEIEEKLREKGFLNDVDSRVICRYRIQGVIVDVMPVSSDIFGFTNRWYADGYRYAQVVEIESGCQVKILNPTYFIGTKLEAFQNRGGGDGRVSSDFEDIVFVLNNRSTIWEEFDSTEEDLRNYLKSKFRELSTNPYFYEWISAHLDYNEQQRADLIIERLNRFTGS